MRKWAEEEDEGQLNERMEMLLKMRKSMQSGEDGPLIEEVKSDENVKKGKTVTLDWSQIYDFKLTEK